MSVRGYEQYKGTGKDWLGVVPSHWELKPLWTCFRRSKRTGFPDEELLSVYRDYGVIPKSSRDDNFNKPSEDLGLYQLVEPGDLVINKMKAWQGSVAVSEYRGIVSPAYHVFEPLHYEHSKFLHYLMRSPQYITGYLSNSKGIRVNQWDLEPQRHTRMPLPIPPLEEQQAIANFLDAETSKIDALVAEQRRLIELLSEKRQAVISHAVTKGLDPNVRMKPSGIEWLGDVPEHWEVKSLRRIGQVQNGLNIGGDAFGSGEPFVSYGDVYNNPNVPEVPSGLVESSVEDQQKCGLEVGDVLFTRTSETVDDIGVASTCLRSIPRSTFAGFLIRFRPSIGVLDPRYSTFLFRNQGIQRHFSGTMNIVTRASLSQDLLKQLPVCLPPIEEQVEIAEFIGQKVESFAALIREAEQAIELLLERRTSLISAAVTGKIDVREFACQETD